MVSFYHRYESGSCYGVEKVVGSKSLAYDISDTVESKLDELEYNYEMSFPIYFVDVIYDNNIITVDGAVIDAEDEMYDEELLDSLDVVRFEFSFSYEEDE